MLIITALASFLSGMGIGGGAVFVILGTNILSVGQHEAQTLNLLLFIASGIGATVFNIKKHNIDKKIIKKLIPFLLIGSTIGSFLSNNINDIDMRKYFSIFMLLIGIYEIISSLISLKKQKI